MNPCRHCHELTAPPDARVCDVCAAFLRDRHAETRPDAATADIEARHGPARLAETAGAR